MSANRKQIVITGGAGFIGSNLARRLVSRGSVGVTVIDDLSYGYVENLSDIDQSSIAAVYDSILDVDLVAMMKEVDTVYHFAAVSSLPECQADPQAAIRVNIEGTARVLEAARRCGVRRVIFASTSAVYENSSPPFSEAILVSPDLVYSWSKFSGELLCESYFRNYGLDVVIARFFNVYGPAQDNQRKNPPFTSYLIHSLLNGEQPVLYNVSQIKRDYIYISDLLDLVEFLGNHDQQMGGQIFNLGSGQAYTPLEIFRIVTDLLGSDVRYTHATVHNFWDKYPELKEGFGLKLSRLEKEIYKESICDATKIQNLTGNQTRHSMREGLEAIINSITRKNT